MAFLLHEFTIRVFFLYRERNQLSLVISHTLTQLLLRTHQVTAQSNDDDVTRYMTDCFSLGWASHLRWRCWKLVLAR